MIYVYLQTTAKLTNEYGKVCNYTEQTTYLNDPLIIKISIIFDIIYLQQV